MVKISILSPIRNERDSVAELILRVSEVMNKAAKSDWEYILVDDASTDGTLKVLESIAKKNPRVTLLSHRERRGQTGCFKSGFDSAKGEIVITMDGDLQVLPEDIPLFLKKMEKGYDVVNAIREHRKHPFWIKLASRLYNVLMLILFDSPVMDASSNFTALRTRFVKNLPLRNNDHRYIIPIAMRNGAKRVGEVIVEHHGRASGKSKYSALPKYIKGFPEIFAAWLRIKRGVYDKNLKK